jgi:vacuolar-type H+-ATPase subunit C/Vma6
LQSFNGKRCTILAQSYTFFVKVYPLSIFIVFMLFSQIILIKKTIEVKTFLVIYRSKAQKAKLIFALFKK